VTDVRNAAVKLALTGERIVDQLNHGDEDRARELADDAIELAVFIVSELAAAEPAPD
jgi:hypothetical protein